MECSANPGTVCLLSEYIKSEIVESNIIYIYVFIVVMLKSLTVTLSIMGLAVNVYSKGGEEDGKKADTGTCK